MLPRTPPWRAMLNSLCLLHGFVRVSVFPFAVAPAHPTGGERWPVEYPYSQDYPTLLPHQLTYTLAANTQPPPPYSREPLAGHLSVWKAEDPQAEVRRAVADGRQLESRNELTMEGDAQSRRGRDGGDGQTAVAERRSTRRRHSRRRRRERTHSSDPTVSLHDTLDSHCSAEPDLYEVEQRQQATSEDDSNFLSSPVQLQAPIELPLPSMPMIVPSAHDAQSDELISSDEMIARPCSRQSLRNSCILFVPTSGGDGSRLPRLVRRSPTPTSSNFVPPTFLPRPGSDNESVLPLDLPPPLRSITTPERSLLPPLQSISPSGISMNTSPMPDESERRAERSNIQLDPIQGRTAKKSLSFPRTLPQLQTLPSRLPPLTPTVSNDHSSSGGPLSEQGPSSGGDLDGVMVTTVNAGREEQSSNRSSLSDSIEDNPIASTMEASQDSTSSEAEQNGTLSRQCSVSRQSSKSLHSSRTVTASEKIDQISATALPFMVT